MPFADLKHARIHYEWTGQSNATVARPVLVLSHALGADLSMWRHQTNALANDFSMLCFDTRGHGSSSTPDGPYTVDDLGEDVLELLSALKISHFSFCGLSMGGLIGQWLGVNAGHRLRKLVLANTAARIGVAETWNARIEAVTQTGIAPTVTAAMERWFTPAFRASQPEAVAQTAAVLEVTNLQGYLACCAVVRDADFRGALSEITSPALVISGTYDQGTTPADGRYLVQHIPTTQYVELPAAHLSAVESAEAFTKALVAFLE